MDKKQKRTKRSQYKKASRITNFITIFKVDNTVKHDDTTSFDPEMRSEYKLIVFHCEDEMQ